MAQLKAGTTIDGRDVLQEIDEHKMDKNNPHGVTKEQVGLGNVDNIQQASKIDFDNHVIETLNEDVHGLQAEFNKKSDKLTGNLTFRIPSDYPNLQDAVNQLYEQYSSGNYTIELVLELGYKITSPIVFQNGDYSHFRIISEGVTVELDTLFPKEDVFTIKNCRSPIFSVLFDGKGLCRSGFMVDEGSILKIEQGYGFTYAGEYGVFVRGASSAYIENTVFTNNSQDGNSSSGYSGILAWGGQIFAEGADASNSGTYGAQAAAGGFLSFRDGKANSCARHGIRATNAGTVDARNAQANNCGAHGVYALAGGTVNAWGVSATGCGSNGVRASQNGRVDARDMDVSGSYHGVFAER